VAAQRVAHARGQALLRGHLLPERTATKRARLSPVARRHRRLLERPRPARGHGSARPAVDRRHRGGTGGDARSAQPATRRREPARNRRECHLARGRPRTRRLGPWAEVSPAGPTRSPLALACEQRPGHLPRGRDRDARRDGRRRPLRSDRRRVPPLHHRPRVGRPPFREDALRQRDAPPHLPGGVSPDRHQALPRGGPRDVRVHRARTPAPRRWLLQHARRSKRDRGRRGSRGRVLHLDARRRPRGDGRSRRAGRGRTRRPGLARRPVLCVLRRHRERELRGEERAHARWFGRSHRRNARDERGARRDPHRRGDPRRGRGP